MWSDKLKQLNVNIHIVATGAGASFQNELWEVPGSSAYLSGASFPYDAAEQEELLGFMPTQFCSEEASVDLACAAYMKAYKFGGKDAVGLGLTASVASEKPHRGDHRVYATIITKDKVWSFHKVLKKGCGLKQRQSDNLDCNDLAFFMLVDALDISSFNAEGKPFLREYKDNTQLAMDRFFKHPYFSASGKRYDKCQYTGKWALVPGAFNPPHQGHFGMQQGVFDQYGYRGVFEITSGLLHKGNLTIQDLLQRAKLLKGNDCIFTQQLPLYLDKVKAFPGAALVLGADACLRLFDPKWGLDKNELFSQLKALKTILFVAPRIIDGKLVKLSDIEVNFSRQEKIKYMGMLFPLEGQWDISSTEIRKNAGLK